MDVSTPTPTSDPGADADRWFAQQVQPHEAVLRNWLRVRFPTLADRDDLVQESFLRVWRARRERPIASPKAFLFATARNLALDALRRRAPEIDLGESGGLAVLDQGSNSADALARAEEFQLLQEALQSLPERCRQVFTLRRLHGLSQKEIAARLGIAEKTVEAQNSIAMHKCVEFFARHEAGRARGTVTPAAQLTPAIPAPQHA